MTRYADPTRCPDCGRPITYGTPACTSCALPLLGPVASELFTTLTRADQLLETLRRTPAAAAAPAREPAEPAPVRRNRLHGASVPAILLTLGAGCLLVAAVVFLAVAWVVLGVEGRTAVLVGVTGASAALTWWVSGRALRGATEALGLVTLGLTALDLAGARSAGWFGSPDTATFLTILGLAMAIIATGACLVLQHRPSGAFTSGEVVVGLAAGVAALGVATLGWSDDGVAALAALVTAGGIAGATGALRLVVGAVGAGTVAALAWAGLCLVGLESLLRDQTLAHAWGDLAAWPLLVAALVAGVVVALRILPEPLRVAAGGVAVALVVAALVVPALDEGGTTAVLVALALLVLSSGVLLGVGRPWGATVGVTAALSALPAALAALVLAAVGSGRLFETATLDGGAGDRLAAFDGSLEIAPWLLVPAVVVLVGTALATLRYAGRTPRLTVELPAGTVAGTVLLALASYAVPVWLLVALPALVGLALVLRGRLLVGGGFLVVGLLVGQHAPALALGAATIALAAAAWVLAKDAEEEIRVVTGFLLQPVLALWVWELATLTDVHGSWAAALGIVAIAALVLAVRNPGLELGAVLGILLLGFAGLDATLGSSVWAAVYLTLAGVAASALALLRPDRRPVGWLGGLLLAAATWVRLGDLGVEQPEAYTLPSALALLVVGLLHLRRNPDADTLRALSPGLALALVPSLLWVLVEPGTLRAAVLGLVCLALVLAAVAMRWTAPLVHAGTVGALVVLRHAAPYLDAGVPRWVLIGAAGSILVALGITWESRVRDARHVLGYVASLR